jgi:hypothetical protein
MMRRGVSMPAVQRITRRQPKAALIESTRADFATGRVKLTKRPEFPEPGAIEELFREARKKRA